MIKIEPFKNIDKALHALDNGGRFYNLLTQANDGLIVEAELSKVAGLFNNKQQMMLFLDIAISRLDEEKREEVISKLEIGLREAYLKYKPLHIIPSQAYTRGKLGENTIITGIPTLIESKDELVGFIMIPILTGEVTTFSMIPLMDLYDVYELRDIPSDTNFIIAHIKDRKKLPNKKIQVAGVLKELKSDMDEEVASKRFLEAVYYLDID